MARQHRRLSIGAMRWRDDVAMNATWYPRLLAGCALVLALINLADLVLTPAQRSEQVLLGHMFKETAAQAATILHVLFFAFAAWGCRARRRFMPWVVIGYLVSVVVSLWVFTAPYGFKDSEQPQATLLVNAACTVVLLALCRVTYGRRTAFDQG